LVVAAVANASIDCISSTTRANRASGKRNNSRKSSGRSHGACAVVYDDARQRFEAVNARILIPRDLAHIRRDGDGGSRGEIHQLAGGGNDTSTAAAAALAVAADTAHARYVQIALAAPASAIESCYKNAFTGRI
jgi:hypothetical protein